MRFVCKRCLKLTNEKKIIRMPFEHNEEFWCENCYSEWADGNPHRDKLHKVNKKRRRT